ncbi:MAG TPA: AraC family transcriptional regulator [Blastocatellia bacterium]
MEFLAKIAVKSEGRVQRTVTDSTSRPPEQRQLASGGGWVASDVVCASGPQDQPFEEQHSQTCVAIVVGGTFQYRTSTGRELMLPGALLLGNAGDHFTCGHEHGVGDRCVSFSYTQEFCERFRTGAGLVKSRFKTPRLAPTRALSPLVSRALELLAGADHEAFEELAILVLAQAIQIERGVVLRPTDAQPSSLARVTRVVRMIDSDPEVPHDLSSLAKIARLSPYYFLRMFEGLTGATPHQYLLRVRLRRAAIRLREEPTRILDIALGCGFGDISNFNRTFRAEFGVSPRAYRSKA